VIRYTFVRITELIIVIIVNLPNIFLDILSDSLIIGLVRVRVRVRVSTPPLPNSNNRIHSFSDKVRCLGTCLRLF
jgi:hypothetical protein